MKQTVVTSRCKNPRVEFENRCNEESKTELVEIEDENTFEKCDKCNLTFKNSHNFKLHQRQAHQKTGCYRCEVCGKIFAQVAMLLKHLDKETIESINNLENCPICYHRDGNMTEHLNRCHRSPGKPFYCQICDLRLKSRRELTEHLWKHKDTSAFQCKECDKSFKYKKGLAAHLATHNSPVGQYKCLMCDFTTNSPTTLSTHNNREHAGVEFNCLHPGCSFTTHRKSNLLEHSKTHNKERPHVCLTCGKTFSQVKS